MITLDINPKGMDDEYLKCLNLSFGAWGDRRKYDWYFRRKTAYPDADLLILRRNDDLAAGTAVTYARVAFPNDGEVTVGIMTGTWTLPEFRNQGSFARLVEESLRLIASKGGALLFGFVVDDRSSFRQLVRAGCALFPTSYIFSSAQTENPELGSGLRPLKISKRVIADLAESLSDSGKNYSRFIYDSLQEFESQFIRRPNATEIFADNYRNYGIIEKLNDTDILQLYLAGSDDEFTITEGISGFLANALRGGRKLFLASSQPRIAGLASKLGLEVKTTYLAVLIADESRLRDALGILDPTPIAHSSLLTQPDSNWFLGHWNLHSGNRA